MAEEPFLPEVPHKSLRAAAYAAIRNAIVSGKFKPGSRLIEVELAQQLGISRAPVREALRQLETEGLIAGRPHRGLYVASVSHADLWEIYTLRAAIEGLAVRLVAAQHAPPVIRELEEVIGQMRESAAEDSTVLAALDLRFHEIICTAAGHRRLKEVWAEMQAQVRLFVALTNRHRVRPDQLVAYHEAVLAAIRGGDPERAAQLLMNHIQTVGQQVADAFDTLEQAGAEPGTTAPTPVESPLPAPT